MLEFLFDAAKGRLHIKYTGFWTDAQSNEQIAQFAAYTKKLAATHGAFTLLDDMTDWVPQTQSVVENNTQFGHICVDLPIVRNAMILPSQLIRRQVIRTVQALQCGIFDEYAPADAWLGEAEPAFGRMKPLP